MILSCPLPWGFGYIYILTFKEIAHNFVPMENIYLKIRERARQLVGKHPVPEFYNRFSEANDQSRAFFETDRIISELRDFVTQKMKNNLGHGIDHATKVCLDAGALLLIESRARGVQDTATRRKLLVVQCAALLHDLKRKHKEHAVKGAEFAGTHLRKYPLSEVEIREACQAIRNHEAFKEQQEVDTGEGLLVSNCLYDADKFRWGPDNFTHTVWDMVMHADVPLATFVKHYPRGMAAMSKIKLTFRTETGKKYGPQFIDIGLAVGEKLIEIIKREFQDYV